MNTTVVKIDNKKCSPRKQQTQWASEIDAALKRLRSWQVQAEKINKRYLSERVNDTTGTIGGDTRINLFYSNVSTLEAMLYGSVPKIDVSRRYHDASDDAARVAAEVMERLLNSDLATNGKEYDTVLRSTLQDRLLSGLGSARVRYTVETQVNPQTGQEEMTNETAPIDYYYWGDMLWSWGRSFSDLTWIGFRNYLTKEEAVKRFGAEKAKDLNYKVRTVSVTDSGDNDKDSESYGRKAEVWEIWCKKDRKIHWYAKDLETLLDTKDDTLKLKGFFPCPPFFIANPTTALYIPTPDFILAQDLYNEIDILQTRISILTTAVKAVGVYDSGCTGVERMFQEGTDNTLIPVDSWAAFAEKGGLQGSVQWLPLMDIVGALDKLIATRDQTIGLLQQVSGFSDIMRGSLGNQYEGVGQSSLKAKFGSVRVQALQDQFAQFASDLVQLKAEVIARHFSPETIVAMSNMEKSVDAELLPQAVQLIKNPEKARLSVVIRPESVAMVDYAELKAERMDFLNAISMFLQTSASLIESKPEAEPFLLQMLQWGLAGFKGAQEIEGVMDKAIEGSMKQAQSKQDEPSPEEQAAQMEQQKEQAKLQAEMQKIKAKGQSDMEVRKNDMDADIATAQKQLEFDMMKLQAESQADLAEIRMKAEADANQQQHDARMNALQNQAVTQQELQKTAKTAQIDVEKMAAKAELDIEVDKQRAKGGDSEQGE